MAKVEDLANEIVLAKEQLMNINNTINRDRGVLEDLKKEIKQTEELKKLAEQKLEEIWASFLAKNEMCFTEALNKRHQEDLIYMNRK